MNDKQEAKYSMYLATENFCLAQSDQWSSRLVFADLFTAFQDQLLALTQEIGKQAATDSAGITRHKENLRREIVGAILPYVDALQLNAALNDNAVLLEDSAFTKSDFAYGRYTDTSTNAGNVLNLVDTHLEENLAEYGLAPEGVTQLRTTIAQYHATLGSTRAKISERTVTTAEILRIMEEIDEHLALKLDKAVATYFRNSAANFFAGYQAAREIIG